MRCLKFCACKGIALPLLFLRLFSISRPYVHMFVWMVTCSCPVCLRTKTEQVTCKRLLKYNIKKLSSYQYSITRPPESETKRWPVRLEIIYV
jgi:hypothetical protein